MKRNNGQKGRPRKPNMQPWSVWMDGQTIAQIRDLAKAQNVRQSDLISQAIRKAYGSGS